MNRAEFEGEFDQILRMLREHSFLLYSPSSREEYERKAVAAFTHFRSLVNGCARIELPHDPEECADLAQVTKASVASASRVLSRAGARLSAGGKQKLAEPWLRAAAALKSLG